MNIAIVTPRVSRRKQLRELLQSARDLHVVLEADNVAEVLRRPRPEPVQIFIIDTSHLRHALDAPSQILRVYPEARLLLLTDTPDLDFEIRGMKSGYHGTLVLRQPTGGLGECNPGPDPW